MIPLPSREAVVHEVLMASEVEDARGLAALLHPDVIALVDSGGDLIAPTVALTGPDEVVPELFATLSLRAGTEVREQPVNGAPALVCRRAGHAVAIVSFGIRRGRVAQVWITRSPQKLQRWNAAVTDPHAGLSELVTGGQERPGTNEGHVMKIVVLGGTGLIGSKVVAMLGEHGHEAVAASPSSGVDSYTGEGLADVFSGAEAVVDVTNSPSFEPTAVLDFFITSTTNILAAERKAGVEHHVALSIVGTDRLPDSGYLRAKLAQERLIEQSPVPYSIVRSTQFFEFVERIAAAATVGAEVRLPLAMIQPIAADDVAAMVARVCIGPPVNGIVEVAGPDRFRLDGLVRRALSARDDPRAVVIDPDARYFGARLAHDALLPGDEAYLAEMHFEDWLPA